MIETELNALAALLMVADAKSFTKAAQALGVSPSALSHTVRGLEERLGVRLLARTTRSVAPTHAGEQLLARLRPAIQDLRGALDTVSGLSGVPAGRVRLVVSPVAARMVLAPKLGQFARNFPDVELDVTTTTGGRHDLVAERYDAGIHLGEFIERDMIAVRVSHDQRAAIVGSPAYFAAHPVPLTPRELTAHRGISFRHGPTGAYRWEFEKGRQSLAVALAGPLLVDDIEVMIRAALDGVGLAFTMEEHAAPHLASGALVRVLEDWCPPFAGYFLYYPSRRQQPAALSALIDTLRLPPQRAHRRR